MPSPPLNDTKSTAHFIRTVAVAYEDDLRDPGPEVRYTCHSESSRHLVHIHGRWHSVGQSDSILAQKQGGAARNHGCFPGDLIKHKRKMSAVNIGNIISFTSVV